MATWKAEQPRIRIRLQSGREVRDPDDEARRAAELIQFGFFSVETQTSTVKDLTLADQMHESSRAWLEHLEGLFEQSAHNPLLVFAAIAHCGNREPLPPWVLKYLQTVAEGLVELHRAPSAKLDSKLLRVLGFKKTGSGTAFKRLQLLIRARAMALEAREIEQRGKKRAAGLIIAKQIGRKRIHESTVRRDIRRAIMSVTF